MPVFQSEGVEIHYDLYGEGPPVLLIHGFASNGRVNWVDTSWTDTITEAGFQAIVIDNRGHGDSEKLYDPEAYPAPKMAKDALNLIDHLDLGSAALLGYSMGARISAFAAIAAPEKVKAVIFGGLGINMVRGMSDSEEIVAALLAPSAEEAQGRTGRQFRIFAERTGSDFKALAACMSSSRDKISEEQVRAISVPALVAVGSDDTVSGDGEALAALLPKGESLVIPGRDHMRATGDPVFKQGAVDFLNRYAR